MEWLFYYQRCLFSGLELYARYAWWVMAPNAHCSLSPIRHLCILPCIIWKLQVYVGVLHIEQLLYCQRHSLCGLWRWMRDPTGNLQAPDVSWSFSDRSLCCIHRKLVCTSLFGMQLYIYAWQQNSCSIWLYYTPNDGFTAYHAPFYKNKFG